MCNIVCYFLQRVSRSCADAKQLVFVFCKIKKSSVFLGITLSTSPTDLPFTFTHTRTHTPVTPICIRIRIRHVIIFVFPMQRERDSLMMMMNVAQEFANLGQLG